MKISNIKREKISEQILAYLYSISPKPAFTSHIAREIARDEEFIKDLLFELKKKNLILDIKKNAFGLPYKRRLRWKLSNSAYNFYRQHQHPN
ncbi:MAG: hypothetical protein KKF48_03070 [Nanoarchaeota archaeon]|nr:hypothetical protein [Nanoarchaeota archaeon]MBU1028005.1 hypothetical protein [Nanoarchaeota archaeon]